MSFISVHFPEFCEVPSPAWATSQASLASPASLAGADADDEGDAGDVAQEVLRMQQKRTGPQCFYATVFRTASTKKKI